MMEHKELIYEIERFKNANLRRKPPAVIYEPHLSLNYFLRKTVSSYTPYLLEHKYEETLLLKAMRLEREEEEKLKSGAGSFAYEETLDGIVISALGEEETVEIQEGPTPEEIARVKKKKRKAILLAIILDVLAGGALVYAYLNGMAAIMVILMAVLVLVLNLIYFNSSKMMEKKLYQGLEGEFTRIFAYFSIYIKNGFPCYTAIQGIIPFASPRMQEKLRTLLNDIDHDKTVMPFIKFGETFESLEIKQVLVSIYKMSEEGGSDAYIRQFDTLFRALAANERRNGVDKKKSRLETLGMLPLVGSAIAMMAIIVSVISLLEGMGSYGI